MYFLYLFDIIAEGMNRKINQKTAVFFGKYTFQNKIKLILSAKKNEDIFFCYLKSIYYIKKTIRL